MKTDDSLNNVILEFARQNEMETFVPIQHTRLSKWVLHHRENSRIERIAVWQFSLDSQQWLSICPSTVLLENGLSRVNGNASVKTKPLPAGACAKAEIFSLLNEAWNNVKLLGNDPHELVSIQLSPEDTGPLI